jgi:hypothetical protein
MGKLRDRFADQFAAARYSIRVFEPEIDATGGATFEIGLTLKLDR